MTSRFADSALVLVLVFIAATVALLLLWRAERQKLARRVDTLVTASRTSRALPEIDKPADPSLFESINASIEKAVLIGDDDNKVVLYSGPTKTVDLLRLKNESIPFTFKDDVPVGEYCKIRLILSDLELVLADDTPADSTDNETYHPKLPGNGKLDMVARWEPAPGVSRTRYSDGTEVTVNRNEEDLDGINPGEVRWERGPTGR